MIYDSEARNFDVELKSPEIVREDLRTKYTKESLLSLSGEDVCKELPSGIVQSTFRDLRICYTREYLISLAEVNECKKLPCGLDLSSISDLQDRFKLPPEIREQPHHESVSAGGFQEVSKREYNERWNSFKLSTADSADKSAPEIQKLQGHDSLSAGRVTEASTEESTTRWDTNKLINAEVKSTDSDKFNCNQLRRPLVSPTATSISKNTPQNPEESGLLGSWSGTKPTSVGSEVSALKHPGSESLLSRCSQPYRPPSYYKAMSNPETPKDWHSNKTFEPTKQRATEERWRKDPVDLIKTNEPPQAIEEKQKLSVRDEKAIPKPVDLIKTNEPLQAIEEKQKSSECDEKVIPKSVACRSLEDHSALQVINRFRVTPPISPSVSASAESLCSTCETTESCLTEDTVNDQPLLQGEEVSYLVETPQPHILEGGQFSALIVLEDSEDIDPDLIEEANLESKTKPRDDHKIVEGRVRFSQTHKKRLRAEAAPFSKSTEKATSCIFPNHAARKTSIKSLPVKASIRSTVLLKPLSETSNSQGDLISRQQKDIDIDSASLQKGFAEKTSIKSLPVNASISYSAVLLKPRSEISNSQGGLVAQQQKGIDFCYESLPKGFAEKTSKANVSFGSLSEICPSSHFTKHQDIPLNNRDSCKLDSESAPWILDSDKGPSSFLPWPNLSSNNIWGTSTDTFTKGNLLDKGQSREPSFYDQEFQVGNNDSSRVRLPDLEGSRTTQDLGDTFEELARQIFEGSKFNPSSPFDDEADSNIEINLPDEDSLITVDDTFIFLEDMLNQSPEIPSKGGSTTPHFSGLNKPMQMNNLHQNLIIPDRWFHDSRSNVAKPSTNPSTTQTNFRAPPQPQDPWRFYHHYYGLLPIDLFSIGQPPVMPPVYEPAHLNFVSPRTPTAHNFYPHIDNPLPSEPPSYHHIRLIPWCPRNSNQGNHDSNPVGSLSQNYQGNNVTPTFMGMRGCHGEKETRPTFSEILKVQIEMAKRKLEAAPGLKPRPCSKPIINPHR